MTWDPVKLGDICDFQNGFAFKSSLFKEAGKPILRISNIQNQTIDTNKIVFFNPENYEIDFAKYEVKPNDLLIAMSGATTGKIGFNDTDTTFYLNQRVGNLKPNSSLDKKYLYYFLSTKVEENLKISKGAAQPNLSSEQIKNIDISLPPLSVQKQIVEKLDTAFADIDKAISATEKNIENAESLFQQTLNNFFTINDKKWISSKFIDVLVKTESTNPKDSPEKTFTYVDVSSVSRDLLIVENPKIIQGKDAPSRARKLIKTNNIIFSTVRPTLKRIAIIEEDLNNQVCSTGFYIFQPKDILDSRYIYYFLQTSQFINIMEKIQTGASYPAVTNKQIEDQVINFPKLEEQKEITQKLDYLRGHVKKLVSTYKSKLMHLNSLKPSILNQAFSGELTKDAA